MKRIIYVALITGVLFNPQIILGQADTSKPLVEKSSDSSNWKYEVFLNLGINGSLISNWTPGGANSFSLQSISKLNGDYKKNKISFTNEVDLIYELATSKRGITKNADLIQLEHQLNYALTDTYHLLLSAHLTTQFSPGYIYTDTDTGAEIETKTSSFLSPALSHEGIGLNIIKKSFKISIAPLGMQQTIVIDPDLDTDLYGFSSGKLRNEFGNYINANANFSLFKNKLSIDSDLIIFTPYKDFDDVDLLFKYLIAYKISKVFSITSSMFIIYNDDIGRPKLIDTTNNGIPDTLSQSNAKLQLKQVFSIGVNYTM
tara:strand:+ start:879 stop:1823 length:945 start_codon:yes stop_codon:yes gene_type:complete